MAKNTIQARLKQISADLQKVARDTAPHGKQHVDPRESFEIGRLCDVIGETAATVNGDAREAHGAKPGTKARLVRKVRAALGYLYA